MRLKHVIAWRVITNIMEATPMLTPMAYIPNPDTTEVEYKFVFDSYPQRVFIACLFLTVFISGTIGNTLTILAVLFSRKLQNTTNTFLFNLAVSDLLSSIFIPWSVAGMLIRGEWPDNLSLLCSLAGGILFVTVGSSFYTLASIALNRLLLITCSKKTYDKVFSRSVLVVWVAFLWIIPFCFCIVPPLAGVGALGFNPKYRTCSDISEGYHDNASQLYDFIQAAGVFPIPLIIIVFSYVRIISFVWSHSKKFAAYEMPMKKTTEKGIPSDPCTSSSTVYDSLEKQEVSKTTTDATSQSETVNISSNTIARSAKKRKLFRKELRVTKNLFIIFCAFMICLFPYVVCLVIDQSDPVVPYAAACLLFNSCINPIIYAIRFPNFKTIFKAIVTCHWYDIPEPSSLLVGLKNIFNCACCNVHYV